MNTQLNWKNPSIPWDKTDTALAKIYGRTRQAVSAARERHGKPASPSGHGGARRGNPLVIEIKSLLPKLPDSKLRQILAVAQK